HEIVQREAVVAGDEVDAGRGPAPRLLEEIGGAREAVAHLTREVLVALPEAPEGVAELAVPLGPANGEAAELVAALARVPGLGDELLAREHGILVHGAE